MREYLVLMQQKAVPVNSHFGGEIQHSETWASLGVLANHDPPLVGRATWIDETCYCDSYFAKQFQDALSQGHDLFPGKTGVSELYI